MPDHAASPAPPTAAPIWATRDDLPTFSPAPGITAQAVAGAALMTVWMRIEPETELAVHHHPNEQIGVVLDGAIAVTIGGETRRAEGCLVLESFAPPRESFLALVAAARAEGNGRGGSHRT